MGIKDNRVVMDSVTSTTGSQQSPHSSPLTTPRSTPLTTPLASSHSIPNLSLSESSSSIHANDTSASSTV
jgi:hypothetical protein